MFDFSIKDTEEGVNWPVMKFTGEMQIARKDGEIMQKGSSERLQAGEGNERLSEGKEEQIPLQGNDRRGRYSVGGRPGQQQMSKQPKTPAHGTLGCTMHYITALLHATPACSQLWMRFSPGSAALGRGRQGTIHQVPGSPLPHQHSSDMK